LSNLETDKKKLLQLVLAGQQELQVLLARPELRQLRQRITISCRLDLIDRAELKQYISLRLFIAGDNGKISFTDTAVKKIHKASQGIPRLINIICDYALIAAYISDSYIINKAHAGKAINELRHQSLVDRPALSGSISCITEKRIWFELLLLFAGLLYLAFVYSGEIFDKGPLETFVQHENKVLHITKSPSSNTVNAVVSSDNIPVDVIQEDPTVTEVKSMSPEANTDSIIEKPDNYIIQIYSIKNRDAAMKEVMTLRQKGLDVHWNPVHMIEKGTWYRVYQGGFSTKRDAMAFKKEKGFPEGIIIYAPWTILINSRNNVETSEDLFQRLQKKGIDCVLESDGDTGHRIISGAFRSSERAQKASLEILDMGLNAKPILR
ncbi:MAG: SPOR domain-containing protein, partial [Deltaproteobacteria bacterium]|nr:SPOR domain-containing protein [Deltaproteobacteria bacterium]